MLEMIETILNWALIGLEIIIVLLLLMVWLTPQDLMDEVLSIEEAD